MENNKYTLEPYNGINSRYQCPSCQKKGEFSQYINLNTGEHLHPSVGMCNRVIKCGYHYPPKQYFEANKSLGITYTQMSHFKPQIKPILKPHYISVDTVASTLETPRNTDLIKFLEYKYGEAETNKVISKYQLGAVKNDVVFWQIDTSNRVRTGKIMKYDSNTGKRLDPLPILFGHINTFTKKDSSTSNVYLGKI
jgi:hypothetical protein